jgi:hypothetical protein
LALTMDGRGTLDRSTLLLPGCCFAAWAIEVSITITYVEKAKKRSCIRSVVAFSSKSVNTILCWIMR